MADLPIFTEDRDVVTIPDPGFAHEALGGNDNISGSYGGDTVYGGSGDDWITGWNGNDSLDGGEGDDILDGESGDDTLIGGEGFDHLTGGSGNDLIEAGDGGADIFGGTYHDTLIGGAQFDYIDGGDGHDEISAGDGNDDIYEDNGNNLLNGEGGDDTFVLEARTYGQNTIDGGEGNDLVSYLASTTDIVINFTGTPIFVYGGVGDGDRLVNVEAITCGSGNDFVRGSAADEYFRGEMGHDTLSGGEGNDLLIGGMGNDSLRGDAGDDRLSGREQTDTIEGGAGNDRLTFGAFEGDVIRGGDDTDTIVMGVARAGIRVTEVAGLLVMTNAAGASVYVEGVEVFEFSDVTLSLADVLVTPGQVVVGSGSLAGGAGSDTILGAGADDTIWGNEGDDHIQAEGGNDRLFGGAGKDMLLGGAGNDVLVGGAGADKLIGGTGNDIYTVESRSDQVVELANGGTLDQVRAKVSYVLGATAQIELLRTEAPAAVTALDLTGNRFDQTVQGNAGANRIDGGAGKDVLTGGAGADVFVFSARPVSSKADRITDYATEEDQIELAASVFAGLGLGVLAESAFVANAAGLATTAQHRLIYETDNGFLWFDADGSQGGSLRIKVADLAGGLNMSASEFLVV